MKQIKQQNVYNRICLVTTIATTIKAFFVPQIHHLTKAGFDISVVCAYDEELQELLGEQVRYIPIEIPRGISFVGTLKSISALRKLFYKEKYDLVQYSTPNAAFCAAIASWMVAIERRNYHLMGFRHLGTTGIGRGFLKVIERITCKLSTSIECVSPSNLKLGVSEKIFNQEKATVVWNGSTGGVDLERFNFDNREKWRTEIRSELGYSKDDFVFGFIGRITRDKGINEILGAYQHIEKKAKLLLVGSSEGITTLDINLLNATKSDPNVLFLDSVTDVERYYAAIDVLLLPSHREGFGNVVIEAAAVGTPAIVSDIPGPTDAIVEGKTALVVNAKDAADLRNKMNLIMKMNYEMMGKQASEFVTSSFDNKVLNQKIYERKMELLL